MAVISDAYTYLRAANGSTHRRSALLQTAIAPIAEATSVKTSSVGAQSSEWQSGAGAVCPSQWRSRGGATTGSADKLAALRTVGAVVLGESYL